MKEPLMYRFESPFWLAALLVLPWIVYRTRRRNRPRISAPTLGMADALPLSFIVRTRWIIPGLKIAAIGLVILAMARPQWGSRETVRLTEGVNIVLAMDLSESMSALDFKMDGKAVNRLDAVKRVVKDFISKRDGDRIGLVVFGSEAYTQLPLTSDYSALLSIIDRLEIGAAGKSTAIGDAIGISLKRLRDIDSKSNIVILLTDGRSNTGELNPSSATAIAVENKVKVYTIGVGTKGPVPFVINDPLWGQRVVYQEVDIDEGALKEIADRTGGSYFHASDSEGLKKIYDTIDRMERTEVRVKSYDNFNDLYPWFALPAMAVLFLSYLLSNTRYLEIP